LALQLLATDECAYSVVLVWFCNSSL